MVGSGGNTYAECVGHITDAELFATFQGMENLQAVSIGNGGKQYPGILQRLLIRHRGSQPLHNIYLEARNAAKVRRLENRESFTCYLIRLHV